MFSSKNYNGNHILGNIINALGIISALIYFTGRIYLWKYFSAFNVPVNRLDLPLDTFFLASVEVLFGSVGKLVLTTVLLILTIKIIEITLWLLQPYNYFQKPCKKYIQRIHFFWLFRQLRSFLSFFSASFLSEVIVILWILTVLFWLAQFQGYVDASLDAVNATSSKPTVTLVSPSKKSALGRDLNKLLIENDPFYNPSLKGYHIIGDVEQFNKIWGVEINDKNDPEQPVWRLLVENEDWVYIFQALPFQLKKNATPPVLAVSKQNGQLQFLILGSS